MPAASQYFGDGVAPRGPGYGVHTVRVDGTMRSRCSAPSARRARQCMHDGPAVLVEAMTYQMGHRSISDDSFACRPKEEVEERRRLDAPTACFRLSLERRGWLDARQEPLRTRIRDEVRAAFRAAEARPKPELQYTFTEVYGGEEP